MRNSKETKKLVELNIIELKNEEKAQIKGGQVSVDTIPAEY